MVDIPEVEVLLAQKLSSGEPRIRKKALYRLEQRINACSSKNACATKEDFLKLWKGLYFCFWLQDKPLMQEELVDSIVALLGKINDTNQKLLFIEGFYEEIGNSWFTLDQWRMDKYLMFYRRMFRQILRWLKNIRWSENEMKRVFDIFRRCGLNADPDAYPLGLKLHFVSIYLDELDNMGAGELNSKQIHEFLSPFLDLLSDKKTNDTHFNAVLDEIFKLILQYCVSNQNEKKDSDQSTSQPILEFDLNRIKSMLFDIGKSKGIKPKRRGLIYRLVKKYDLLLAGKDPFYVEISEEADLSEEEIDQAAENLWKRHEKLKKKMALDETRKKRKMNDDGEERNSNKRSKIVKQSQEVKLRKKSPLNVKSISRVEKLKLKGRKITDLTGDNVLIAL
uniref:Uncharacterized protein n=1 Tax=Romanomermis culicivorax TaxID=13658 RepID=A0A915KH16_ROMCU